MAVKKTAVPESTTALSVMPKFVVKELKSYDVEANFAEVETYLKGVRAKYKDVAFSPENIDEVVKVKAEMVGLRTSLTSITDAVKKQRFNGPKKTFETVMNALIAIAGEVEAEVDKVLAAKDQERIDELNEVFEGYKEHFQTVFGLEESFLARVELKKHWYNKTAKEKESKDELEAQFKTLKTEQTARNGSIKLIKKALASTPQINEQAQIDKLDAGTDIASILEWIEGEQQRLACLANAALNEPEEAPGHVLGSVVDEDEEELAETAKEQHSLVRQVEGVVHKIDFSTDLPGKTKTVLLEITYPYDGSAALTALFKKLTEFGITSKILPRQEVS